MIASLAIFLVACARSPAAPRAATASSRPAEVPAAGVLTLATEEDMKEAAKFGADPLIQTAINDYLADPKRHWTLVAARPMDDYVLLWIAFPGIADGGIDLIYSKKEHRIGWEFKGGLRG